MTRVLVVEDETSYSEALSYVLRKEGFEVAIAETGPDAITEFDRGGADIVLLDLMLPGLPGTEVCRQLRQRSSVPIIMVSAKDTEVDKVVGLELGADDYVTKPFVPHELTARIRALLRRTHGALAEGEHDRIQIGDVELRPREGIVRKRGEEVHLTKTEFRLLCDLAEHRGQVMSRDVLLERVWG
ncbi:MAG TPA: response regulator transcription factor, partial [Aeromicrobium sp.]|nr:response regulator transcription factor [Aeromicrobium sp.]